MLPRKMLSLNNLFQFCEIQWKELKRERGRANNGNYMFMSCYKNTKTRRRRRRTNKNKNIFTCGHRLSDHCKKDYDDSLSSIVYAATDSLVTNSSG